MPEPELSKKVVVARLQEWKKQQDIKREGRAQDEVSEQRRKEALRRSQITTTLSYGFSTFCDQQMRYILDLNIVDLLNRDNPRIKPLLDFYEAHQLGSSSPTEVDLTEIKGIEQKLLKANHPFSTNGSPDIFEEWGSYLGVNPLNLAVNKTSLDISYQSCVEFHPSDSLLRERGN